MAKRSGTPAKSYSANPRDYKRLEEIGNGASATVYRAIYLPFNEVVAIKCLDLDRCNNNLDDMRREAQTMSLIDHPNVVKAYCSFVVERDLWVVMPFMSEGSCLHLIKIAYPDGFEEPAIRTILRETLKALEYLHKQGHIHRDVKAGNVLLDSNGTVKLADFGVTACMFDNGDRQRSRKTFVGTPCWMAPEVLQPDCGYDFKADIWSFGITALELAHGHAPFSKYPPMKVLMMTIQYAPPGLDYERDKKFSKSFKEMVAMCLVKDPKKRPSVEKLLKHSFFKHTKPPEVYVKKLFADLPPLWDRVKAIQIKDAASLASKKMPLAEQEALSQSEYQRGVSAWNFDMDDMKLQASLIQDDGEISEVKEGDESEKPVHNNKGASFHISCSDEAIPTNVNIPSVTSALEVEQTKIKPQPTKRLQTQSGPLIPGIVFGASSSSSEKSSCFERSENGNLPTTGKSTKNMQNEPSFSGLLLLPNRASANSLSAPIRSTALDDKVKASLVQIKGRFSVTSANVDIVKDLPLCAAPVRSKGSSLRKSASVGEWMCDEKKLVMPAEQFSKDLCNGNLPPSIFSPHLQNLLEQTSIQQDFIMDLLTNLQSNEPYDAPVNGKIPPLPLSQSSENGNIEAESSEKERLLVRISELQNRTDRLTEELNAEMEKYHQLQQRLTAIAGVKGDCVRAEN